MTDQKKGNSVAEVLKVNAVAEVLFADREAQRCPYRVASERRFNKALKALLKALLGREPTDQEIQDAENL